MAVWTSRAPFPFILISFLIQHCRVGKQWQNNVFEHILIPPHTPPVILLMLSSVIRLMCPHVCLCAARCFGNVERFVDVKKYSNTNPQISFCFLCLKDHFLYRNLFLGPGTFWVPPSTCAPGGLGSKFPVHCLGEVHVLVHCRLVKYHTAFHTWPY